MGKWALFGMAATSMVVVGVLVAEATKGFYNPFESSFIKSCEVVLTERLRSPSRYERVSLRESRRIVALAEYLHAKKTDAGGEALYTRIFNRAVESKQPPTLFRAEIIYDAPNAFGVPLRGYALCEYYSDSDSKSGASKLDVLINGKSQIDYLSDLIDSRT